MSGIVFSRYSSIAVAMIPSISSIPGLVFAAAILACAFLPAQAQIQTWEPIGPFSGALAAVVAEGDVVLAAPVNNGLVRSTDAGGHWSRVDDPFGADPVHSLFSHSGTLFACGRRDYRSTDAGATWSAMNVGAAAASFGMCTIADTLYLASVDGDVHRSVDNGDTWRRVGGAHGDWPGVFAAHGSRLYLSLDADFYISDDGGVSWKGINMVLVDQYVDAFAANDSVLIASFGARLGGVPDRLHRSTDGGVSWTLAHNGFNADRVNAIIWNGAEFLAAGSVPGGLFHSADGAGWARYPAPAGEIFCIANNGRVVYAGSGHEVDGRLYQSVDSGATWRSIDNAYSSLLVSELVRFDDGSVVASANSALLRTIDLGSTWERVSGDSSVAKSEGLVASSMAMLMVPSGRLESGIDRSTDGGATWRRVEVAPGHTYRLAANGAFALALVEREFGAGYDVYRSSNAGASWMRAGGALPFAGYVALDIVGTRVFAATTHGLYRTVDSGGTWERMTRGLGTSACGAIGHTLNDDVVVADLSGDTACIRRSTDGGDTWQRTYTGRTDDAISGFTEHGYTLIAWYREHGVLCSPDGGLTWLPMNVGLWNGRIRSAVAAGPFFLVGTEYGGMFRAPFNMLGVPADGAAGSAGNDAVGATLFPNPCRGPSTVEYVVPNGAGSVSVAIDLLDGLGRRVAEIFGGLQEPGMHRVEIGAARLMAGAYYCRVRVGAAVRTLRLVEFGQ